MTLAELIDLIRSKQYLFEIIVPGSSPYGKQTIQRAEELYGSLESYFTKVAEGRHLKEITVALFAKNGTSSIRRDVVTVQMLDDTEPATTRVNSIIKAADTSAQTIKYEKPASMITKADIEVVQLRTENKYLVEKVEELKQRNKELERKNDNYYTENLRLTREHATEKDKRDLEFKHKELALITQQKNGLSGIMDDVKTMPPEAWQFIAGLLPNHPMTKALGQAPVQTESMQSSSDKHNDPDAQTCIELITSFLVKSNPELVGMMAMLTEHLTTHPAVLKAVYEKFFPNQQQTQQAIKT
jgi:hypothetical protein